MACAGRGQQSERAGCTPDLQGGYGVAEAPWYLGRGTGGETLLPPRGFALDLPLALMTATVARGPGLNARAGPRGAAPASPLHCRGHGHQHGRCGDGQRGEEACVVPWSPCAWAHQDYWAASSQLHVQ